MTRDGLHWLSSTSRPETCWPRRGRSLRKRAKGRPESTPVELLPVFFPHHQSAAPARHARLREPGPRHATGSAKPMAVALHGVGQAYVRMDAGGGVAERAAAEDRNGPAQADRTGIVVSIVPVHTAVAGRARLQVAGLRGAPELAKLIERGLTGFGGVHDVTASAVTGNATGCYARPASLDQIIARIAALLRGEIVPASDEAEPSSQHWHTAEGADIAARLGTSSSQGLSAQEASRRLMRGAANAMPSLRQRSDLSILLSQFGGLPVALLAGAAVVSVAIGSFIEAGAILAVVAITGGIGFATERRAERTIRSLEGV